MTEQVRFAYLRCITLFTLLLFLPPLGTKCVAAAPPVSCDTKGWISTIGLEWITDSCVAKDLTDNTPLHYLNNMLQCQGGNVALYAPYGDSTMTPASLVSYIKSQGYRAFRNREGTHILMVHPSYRGLIQGKDMTLYAAGQVYTDVFSRGLLLPTTPICSDRPECGSCPCPEKEMGSWVNLISGRLSHSQELFALKGGAYPLTVILNYRSMNLAPGAMGSGWSHGYEQSLQILANSSVTFRNECTERDFRFYQENYTASPGDYATLVKNSDGSYLLTEKGGLLRSFDSTGRITSLADRNGNRTLLTYAAGKLSTVTDPSGRSAAFLYDSTGKLVKITDPLGNAYSFLYASGILSAVQFPDGGTWSYTYGNGLLATRSDPAGTVTSYHYDPSNRLLSSVDPQGLTRGVTYPLRAGNPGKVPDAYPRCGTVTGGICNNATDYVVIPVIEKNSGAWQYTYDPANGALVAITDPYGTVTGYNRDQKGNLVSRTEPNGATTRYTYDDSGNVISQTDPLGNNTLLTYNSLGQIITTSGPQGTTSNSYDPRGNLLTSIDSAGATTTYDHDGGGNVTKITTASGSVTTMTYTLEGLLQSSTDPTGLTTIFTYDANGNMLTSTDPPGRTTSMTYDAMNHLTRVVDPSGAVTAYAYDKQGNRVSRIDANGQTTTYGYNFRGEVTENRDPLGGVTRYTYETASCGSCGGVDKLTGLTDARSNSTGFQYDLISRLVRETDPLGKVVAYAYDTVGNPATRTTANGAVVAYSYDLLRRLIGKSYPDGTGETYSYDAAGRLLSTTGKDMGYRYGYDNAGRLSSVADSRGYLLSYDYDILGNRTGMTLQPGTPDQRRISYGYDRANRTTRITSGAGTFTYGYDNLGRRSSSSYPHGVTATFQYDNLNRLTSLTHRAGESVITFANYSGFDKVGNRMGKNSPAGAERYHYDEIYRLKQATAPDRTENFSYDAVGNRFAGPGFKDTKYLYDAANRVLVGRIFGHDYDNAGNQVTRTTPTAPDKGWTLFWNYENHLIRMEKVKGSTERSTITFQYDPQGRRIEKQVTILNNGQTRTTRWRYIYDNDNIVLEIYTSPDGTDENSWYTHGADVDEHLALERGGNNYYYHGDGLGSVTAITDVDKNIVQSYRYDSFGMVTPSSPFRNSYCYTGREWDKEAALYYYRARYYDPMDGRFINKDPIAISGNIYNNYINIAGDQRVKSIINPFVYTDNNPINFTDPTGLTSWNGNLFPGSFPQDNKCSVPATFNLLNDNKCTKQCCKEHDDCYAQHGCNASSWIINGLTTIPVGACQMCNIKAAACIISNLANNKCDDCKK